MKLVDLRFVRVNFVYISAYEALQEIAKIFGVDSVQVALNKIAEEQKEDKAHRCPECYQGTIGYLGRCEICGYNPLSKK